MSTVRHGVFVVFVLVRISQCVMLNNLRFIHSIWYLNKLIQM
jgi:hypothetical protein